MNWIIRYSDRMRCHTLLDVVVEPIWDDLKDLNWLVTDSEHGPWQGNDMPLNYEDDYFILTPKKFKSLVDSRSQIIWGVFLAIPQKVKIIVDEDDLPYAEGNELIWKNGNIQHPDAIMELVCFDSGYTIVKFKDEKLSNKFKAYFDEAIELEKFSNNSAPNY